MVVLPYFLHNILIFRVLTLSVISSTPGESLTLDLRKNWLFSYSFSVRFLSQPEVVGALGWKWTDMIWALSTVNFFCVLVSNVRGQMSLWTVPQPRNPQLCACFHITGWSQALLATVICSCTCLFLVGLGCTFNGEVWKAISHTDSCFLTTSLSCWRKVPHCLLSHFTQEWKMLLKKSRGLLCCES